MGNKELAERLRDAAAALDGTALRVSTSKFDTQIIADLLIDAAEALETCWTSEGLQLSLRKLWEAGANQIDSTKYGDLANCAAAWKPMTNGDRIRAMTDEELAGSEFRNAICDDVPTCELGSGIGDCMECRIKWLGSPAKDKEG